MLLHPKVGLGYQSVAVLRVILADNMVQGDLDIFAHPQVTDLARCGSGGPAQIRVDCQSDDVRWLAIFEVC